MINNARLHKNKGLNSSRRQKPLMCRNLILKDVRQK